MLYLAAENPAEVDARFLGYRLDVISRWPASERKLANAKAISRRLTAIARSALVRPDIEDLMHLSCQLLDDFFAAGERPGYLQAMEGGSSSPQTKFGLSPNAVPSIQPSRAEMPLADW